MSETDPKTQAIQVAREFAALAREEGQTCITSMKLQKLLYYAQLWAIHDLNRPIFSENVEAWKDGPVVPEVFQRFKGQYSVSLNTPVLAQASELSCEDREIVLAVWEQYKSLSGDDLSKMTHDEVAWKNARAKRRVFNNSPKISPEAMAVQVDSVASNSNKQFRAYLKGKGLAAG